MRDSPGAQWFHYSLWEDWHAGLYRPTAARVDIADKVTMLLSDRGAFGFTMTEVGESWPIAVTHNLSNEARNHRPWLGRSAACFRYAASIADTNLAWSMLTVHQQVEANREADAYCTAWRSVNLRGQLRLW